MTNSFDLNNIPSEKFEFAHADERLTDKKLDDKPVSYFKDAWIRFRKNKASVVATAIIICIILFAFLMPLIVTTHDAKFMDPYYAKKGSRNVTLSKIGIADGSVNRDFSEKGIIRALAIGMGAEDYDGKGTTLEEGFESYYQPIVDKKLKNPKMIIGANKKEQAIFNQNIDVYLEVGFMYKSIQQKEYQEILDYQEKTGIQVLFPLVEANEYNPDPADANNWYKMNAKSAPVSVDEAGNAKSISILNKDGSVKMSQKLEDNYKRDENGNIKYYEYTGGGTLETAQYKIRVLYYNWYVYKNGFEPEYIFGTDSQGYDLALRMADGIKLSLLVAVCVSVINFVIGAIYGAVEGYYGGACDMILERISDILAGVPFIIVATLFQIHLAAKLGPIACLLFAYVLTGWIGTASRVRTQFYRFKNQEYVMAARTLGASDNRIIWKHIFPNTLGTLITSSALVIPGVINSESMLSYLGIVKLGTADTTSLGTLLADASSIWTNYPHLMIYPAIVLSLLMICFNLFGNGLRDAFNPSLRGVED